MTNAIKLKLFGQATCNPCKILKFAIEAELDDIQSQGVDFEYVDLTDTDEAKQKIEETYEMTREEMLDQYEISSTPVVIIERNGHKMADIRSLVNIREVKDAIEFAKTAR